MMVALCIRPGNAPCQTDETAYNTIRSFEELP
jgi:hypothetical protein